MEWDEFFAGMAVYVSRKSKDESTKVGCVIVDYKKRVVSVGFNGFPAGRRRHPGHEPRSGSCAALCMPK
jgi:deoxycytidylate deaminase